jgi:DNA-binding transcriptional ArsR family regulator
VDRELADSVGLALLVVLDKLAPAERIAFVLHDLVAMSLAAVSKHVKVLEKAGLVRRTRQGREHTLELDAAPLREIASWAAHYEQFWTERLDRLEAYFANRRPR